jgi:hypothetical protein
MEKRDWQVVETLSQQWVRQRTDDTEVKRLVSYLRQLIQQGHESAGDRMFEYVQVLKVHGDLMRRSNQTEVHYQAICDGFEQHLEPYRDHPERLLEVLGWVGRVMKSWKSEG